MKIKFEPLSVLFAVIISAALVSSHVLEPSSVGCWISIALLLLGPTLKHFLSRKALMLICFCVVMPGGASLMLTILMGAFLYLNTFSCSSQKLSRAPSRSDLWLSLGLRSYSHTSSEENKIATEDVTSRFHLYAMIACLCVLAYTILKAPSWVAWVQGVFLTVVFHQFWSYNTQPIS